jgi:flagellar secretion chaperone FliS
MNARDTYLESRILTADPLELVRVLYRAAIEAVEDARQALADRDIQRRTRNINRAIEILTELTSSLQRGEESGVKRNLVELYDYMQRKLLEAHFQQAEPPLIEVSGLLRTILDGWEQCQPEKTGSPAPSGGYQQTALASDMEEELSEEYAPLSCSY